METGCYAVGLLLLCRWLDDGRFLAAQAGWQRGVALGLFLGLLLLARNDAVLVIPFVLAAVALAQPDRRTLQRIMLVAVVSAVILSPWLAYTSNLTGSIMPQGGLATGVDRDERNFDPARASAATRAVLELTVPPLVARAARLPSWCLVISAVILCAAFIRVCRRDAGARRMARSTAWLAAGAAALVAYYLLFSRATWMYPRYFMPVRLLALGAWMWLVLDTVGRLRAWRAAVVATLVLVAVAFSVGRTAHTFGASTPFTGDDLRMVIAAGLCDGPARVGIFDSGRIAYRCAPYVFNLDGKASLAALHAMSDGSLLAHLASFHIDRLFLKSRHVDQFDRSLPDWRRQFSLVTAANGSAIFARSHSEPDAAGRSAAAQVPRGD
jgi:4-amino-4-deoxy-L-arabinose transferase-like glycosyltransferase